MTFDATWMVKVRSAIGGVGTCTTNSLAERFAGSGQVILPHHHILFANATVPAYNGPTAADGTYTIGVPDAGSVVLLHGNTVVDALCFYFDTVTEGALTGCSAAYTCRGAAVVNPHDNTSSTNVDASLERRPGGAEGNAVDTGDNAADFIVTTPADRHRQRAGALELSTEPEHRPQDAVGQPPDRLPLEAPAGEAQRHAEHRDPEPIVEGAARGEVEGEPEGTSDLGPRDRGERGAGEEDEGGD